MCLPADPTAFPAHYNDVIKSAMASQITNLMIVYSSVNSGTDQRKHLSSASLAFVRGIHRWPVNSPHRGPVTRKMSPSAAMILRVTDHKETIVGQHCWPRLILDPYCKIYSLVTQRYQVTWVENADICQKISLQNFVDDWHSHNNFGQYDRISAQCAANETALELISIFATLFILYQHG